MKKILLLFVFLIGFNVSAQDFKWSLKDAGTGNGWVYLKVQWTDNCDTAIIALFDDEDNFLIKETIYLDFGVGETLVLDGYTARKAKYARIKCRY